LQESDHLRVIRLWLSLFIAGLVLSGVTAFPLEAELHWFLLVLRTGPLRQIAEYTHFLAWIMRVYDALCITNKQYPFLAYGTDWLAFAHLVIAFAFLGPYRDPVRNRWFITFGLCACAGVIPLALIAGPLRGIPIAWRIIDCSFGVIGAIPLLLCRRHILALENLQQSRILPHTPAV
jgi:hypothetical protein